MQVQLKKNRPLCVCVCVCVCVCCVRACIPVHTNLNKNIMC